MQSQAMPDLVTNEDNHQQQQEQQQQHNYPCRYSRSLPNKYIPPPNFGMVEENVYRSGLPNELNFPFLERLSLHTIIYLSSEQPPQKFLNFVEEHGIVLRQLDVVAAPSIGDGPADGSLLLHSSTITGQGSYALFDSHNNDYHHVSGVQGHGGTLFSNFDHDAHVSTNTASHRRNYNHQNDTNTQYFAPQNEIISEELVLEALNLILNPQNYPLLIMCNLGRHRTGTIVGCLRKVQNWSLTAIFEEYRRYCSGSKVKVLNEQFIELFDVDLVRATANNAFSHSTR